MTRAQSPKSGTGKVRRRLTGLRAKGKKLGLALTSDPKNGRVAVPRTAEKKTGFVLVYKGLDDPDKATVSTIARKLAPATVEEVLPGTLKVVGDDVAIRKMAVELDSWQLAQEGRLSNTAPSATQFDYLRT